MHEAVYKRLVRAARTRKTVPLREVAALADLSLENADDAKILGLILDEIADHEHEEGRPLLPVVVVDEMTNLPAPSLFRYSRRNGLQSDDNATYFTAELGRVHTHWAGGKATE